MTLRQVGNPGLMVSRVEALGFRSLRYVSQSLGRFHVLVGPNASGKSAFLDVLAFLSDLQRTNLERTILDNSPHQVPRATAPRQLTWMDRGESFELAMEARIPSIARESPQDSDAATCRYEIAVRTSEPYGIEKENLWLKPQSEPTDRPRSKFPSPIDPPPGIVADPEKRAPPSWRRVISRDHQSESATFRSETSSRSFRLRILKGKSALGSLPAETELFPVAGRFQQMLTQGVRRITLSSEAMRRSSPPKLSHTLQGDGSNLPHVVEEFMHVSPDRYARWLLHVREALPDIERLSTRTQPWDGHRYLVVHYRNGLIAPSWLVSEGTVRFLALTLLAYLPSPTGPYLIEEPENGIHPYNVETVLQSLSSIHGAQVLLATHSPAVVHSAGVETTLCFSRDDEGGTDIVAGPSHPRLRHWTETTDLGLLFGSGVLG